MKKVYLLSIFMAIVVGIAVYFFASSMQKNNQSPAVSMSKVVVAVTEVPANTLILEDMVALVTLPSEGVNPYAATNLAQVVGTITQYPLLPNEQVLSPRLVEKGVDSGTLSLALAEGQRAVSVGVDEVSGVSGYITKGDYVDVIATLLTKDTAGNSVTISVSLVENLLVLEAGSKKTEENTEATGYTTITLSATPEEVLKINYAATNGKLRLVLRPILDNKIVNPEDYHS
ncbi:MAG: Flp pilus assembly protein CpaB [Christensenellales bacterium]